MDFTTGLNRHVTIYIASSSDTADDAISACAAIVKTINDPSNPISVLALVQALGEYLTSEDNVMRAKGTGLLSNVLAQCDGSQINKNSASVLVEFYCERLGDQSCVSQVLQGFIALSKLEDFSGDDAIKTSKTIFNKVSVQTFPQVVRHSAFELFENLIDRHQIALKRINDDFVYGFTQVMDGEKDPRNLMLAFLLVKNIIKKFDIVNHAEDLFEVTFCYFPITFRPPPDDPYGITADDLKVGLRECLAATPQFAKLALPLIIEKLSSSSGNAKKDSMDTIIACAPVYGAAALAPYVDELFDALKVEIYHATDDTFEEKALSAIHSIVATISTGVSVTAADPTEKALGPMIAESLANFKDPEARYFRPAAKILRAAASASDPACNAIIIAAVPELLRKYRDTQVATQRKAILDAFLDFLEANKTLYGSIEDEAEMNIDDDFITPLLAYKDRFFEIFGGALMASNEYGAMRLAGLKGLHIMILLKSYLSVNEVGIGVQYFNQVMFDETDDDLRTESLKSLSLVARYKPDSVLEHTVPSLIVELPEHASEIGILSPGQTSVGYGKVLGALGELAVDPVLFDAIVPQLLRKFDGVAAESDDVSYPYEILSTLLKILHTKNSLGHTDIPKYMTSVVLHLLSHAVVPTLYKISRHNIFEDIKVLEAVAGISVIIFRKLNTKEQQSFITQLFYLFINGDISQLPSSSKGEYTLELPFAPFEASAPTQQSNLALLFAAIFGSCRQTVVLPVSNIWEFTGRMISLTLNITNSVQQLACARIVGSIVNKGADDPLAISFITVEIIQRLTTLINDSSSQDTEKRRAALLLCLWTAKALILRSHQLGFEIANQVIATFTDIQLGRQASEGFFVLIGDDDIVLNKASFAIIKLLYKQRFFNHCLPNIVGGFEKSGDDTKHNYLTALSYLLRNVPKIVLLNELPPLLPLLIQSLSLPDPELKVSTIATFILITTDSPQIIQEHIQTVLPAMLRLSQMLDGNTIKVRMAALKCLSEFPTSLRYDILHPYKTQVLKDLGKAVGDRKRSVRREAVDCRAKWFALSNLAPK